MCWIYVICECADMICDDECHQVWYVFVRIYDMLSPGVIGECNDMRYVYVMCYVHTKKKLKVLTLSIIKNTKFRRRNNF